MQIGSFRDYLHIKIKTHSSVMAVYLIKAFSLMLIDAFL